MMDVNPLTLGIETTGGVMVRDSSFYQIMIADGYRQANLIPRNNMIPTVTSPNNIPFRQY